jgi:hypothetical protein
VPVLGRGPLPPQVLVHGLLLKKDCQWNCPLSIAYL